MADTTEIKIDPESINRYVAEKIAESALGETLKKAIDEQITAISKSYDNPMKPAVNAALQNACREYLDTPEIKARLRKAVEDKLTDELISTLIDQLGRKVY